MQPLVLVTGGNGFLARHIMHELLRQEYAVRATLRSLDQAEAVRTDLKIAGTPHLDRLNFAAADLTQDAGWSAAMVGVTTVMSVAAPVFVNETNVADQVATAAEVGTKRILQAAEKAGVKRVVMTANLGAVGFSSFGDHVVTEADWTDPEQAGLSAYERAKLFAERAAWQYTQHHPVAPELVTVNAGAMLGPSLGGHVTSSFGLLTRLIAGKPTPNLVVNVVDVRDVADLHVRAMQTPEAAGQRILAVEDTAISMQEILTLIRNQYPEMSEKLPHRLLPTWLVNGLAPFNQAVKEAQLMMRVSHRVSNQRARQLLNWQPVSSSRQAVLSALASLQEMN
ncbi:oxidoreductase [Levilactobacillus paucivorans]|uniref:Oxidoreductase n=1 Tax=Levilactobacillus paucivorans TaxID=616990 RepID=A0A0R2LRM9_9LACO|nr:NAD-dependent epimerase/dehydratase family protein [Levilactobacillus paucivorans]KRO04073.1 oxidoreductase [Levilactobacillus paucivorans]